MLSEDQTEVSTYQRGLPFTVNVSIGKGWEEGTVTVCTDYLVPQEKTTRGFRGVFRRGVRDRRSRSVIINRTFYFGYVVETPFH